MTGPTPHAEDFDLGNALQVGRHGPIERRVRSMLLAINAVGDARTLLDRVVLSPMGREVTIRDPWTQTARPMLMFGSNNYLGFAHDEGICAAVHQAIDRWGIGVGGPPLLNGTTSLHRELEARLAALKRCEDAVLLPSGYSANLAWVTALVGKDDVLFHDELSHASFHAGVKMAGCRTVAFSHNDIESLEALLAEHGDIAGTRWIAVEGVYSMDGDTANLRELVDVARRYECHLVIDDAHGLGVLGMHGEGTAHEQGVIDGVFLHMGTFSKTLACTGGYLAGRADVVEYLRLIARPAFFTASLPVTIVAAVLAGLDAMRDRPELVAQLRANVDDTIIALAQRGVVTRSESAIIPVRLGHKGDPMAITRRIHDEGIFANLVGYPAVPPGEERLRITPIATHTAADLQRLADVVAAAVGPDTP